MADYTVIVAHRQEGAELKRTIENVHETQKYARLLMVEDDKGLGTGRTRHAGLKRTRAKTVILIDAHMRFDAGALDNLADWSASHPGDVGCLLCHHNEKLEKHKPPCCGAEIRRKGAGYALEAVWRKAELGPGEVECVMGACYAFQRDWYFDAGAPLSAGRGWGCDEQFLSLTAAKTGGRSYCLPWECCHLYKPNPPDYRITADELSRIWLTRYALLAFLRPPDLAELLEYNDRMCPLRRPAEFAGLELAAAAAAPVRKPLSSVRIDGEHCPHCGGTYPVRDYRISNTYGNNRRRVLCPGCGKPHIERS